MIKIHKIESFVYRYPLENPVITSFGHMYSRPMVLVKITDKDNNVGWGEIWCNFPQVGAEHRAKLIDTVFEPIMLNMEIIDAEKTYIELNKKTSILAIQCGESGPISQCIAGLDIALNDLIAKKEQIPLWKKFGGKKHLVPIYASGINPSSAEDQVKFALKNYFQAFKLKVGFGMETDLHNLKIIRKYIGKNHSLMIDANQGWNEKNAIENCKHFEKYELSWAEEVIPADSDINNWKEVNEKINIPLAAGENFTDEKVFKNFIDNKIFSILQPDIAKWGGFSVVNKLSRLIEKSNIGYCPHFLGGGIGLIASAHALSASRGNGILEVDINNNPLRENLVGEMFTKVPGMAYLSDSPGLGIEPNLKSIETFLIKH